MTNALLAGCVAFTAGVPVAIRGIAMLVAVWHPDARRRRDARAALAIRFRP